MRTFKIVTPTSPVKDHVLIVADMEYSEQLISVLYYHTIASAKRFGKAVLLGETETELLRVDSVYKAVQKND